MCGARSFACKWCRDRKTARSTFKMEREDATKARPPAPFGISDACRARLPHSGEMWYNVCHFWVVGREVRSG